MTNKKTTIVSGIRASGRLHIGNYLGALKQFVELQNDPSLECYFFIADLHALTTPFDPQELSQNTLQVAADYLAAGINPDKCVFFLQNQVLEHAELAWIFECITPLGELHRMTQFKEKSEGQKTSVNAGLLTYPCLMAADILIYKPQAVPVGEDQVQHVELTRVIARKFNQKFGSTFPEPKTFTRKPLRIMSLADPAKKMSKTGDEALMLDDEPSEISRKLKKAVTATSGGAKSAGVENLLLLLEHFGTAGQLESAKKQHSEGTLKYSELKETLSQNISGHFAEFREKKKRLLEKPDEIKEILREGAEKARKTAAATLAEVRNKIGIAI